MIRMQVIADIGGIPGVDCKGFCKYCYFKKIKETESLGCVSCSPGRIGCSRCGEELRESKNNFKLPFVVMSEVQNTLMFGNYKNQDLKINISGGGDVSCYPHLSELTATLNQFGLNTHIGYTSGKGFDDGEIANILINNGVDEITYTVFSTDHKLRKEWVNDLNPIESLKALKIFSENITLHGASVIIPGVNDGDVLLNTCSDLEDWGAKAMILMRFANTTNQGIILNNAPIINDIKTHSLEEFGELVKEINSQFNLRVTGTPVFDPETNAPFAIAKDRNEVYLQFIQEVTGEATVISSKISGPYITKIFEKIEVEDVNVISTEKEIACLITKEDLGNLDLSEVKDTVIIPGRSFIHNLDAERIFSKDGKERIVCRGPDKLSVDGEMSGTLTEEQIIEKELEEFRELVQTINFFGMKKRI